MAFANVQGQNNPFPQPQKMVKEIDIDFLRDVIQGLDRPQKSLPSKYFYDELGSQYFDEICDLEEYYPYKTELELLPQIAQDIAEQFEGDYAVVEFGAGSLQKIRPLFEEITGIKTFVPIDISGAFLHASVSALQKGFPQVHMQPVVADFCKSVELPKTITEKKMGFFPGSTIGNFTPADAAVFLQNAKTTLGDDAYLLIGVDTKKSPTLLHQAYNDAAGVTEKFNLNLLTRINRELDGNFDPGQFEHYAFYNATEGRIEMHLISSGDQRVNISGFNIDFTAGESIHTENSYKYTPSEFASLAKKAGWGVEKEWLAKDTLFSTFLLHAA